MDGGLSRRVLYGALMLAGVCGLLAVDALSGRGWGLAVLAAAALALGMREILGLLAAVAPPLWRAPACVLPVLVVGAHVLWAETGSLPRETDLVLVALYLVALLSWALRHEPGREVLVGLALHVFAICYIALPALLVMRLRYLDHDLPPPLAEATPALGLLAVLYAVLVAKGADMAAYFVGRAFGRRKLIPWISPGKTTAGTLGALGGGLAVTAAFAAWSDLGLLVPWPLVPVLAILVTLAGMAGDLVESLVKRSAAVKDSARLVPEFGGVLDIIDSILFAVPVTYLVLVPATSLRT
ncbi:MAG: hypothetical protein KatS3mg102_2265 [Planctomycetota bacterium]|nr:MAG: hypothetical protein KatS3mg102_2265 [Planctomycetota bacterium]